MIFLIYTKKILLEVDERERERERYEDGAFPKNLQKRFSIFKCEFSIGSNVVTYINVKIN